MNRWPKMIAALPLILLAATPCWAAATEAAGKPAETGVMQAAVLTRPQELPRISRHGCTPNILSCYSSCINSDWAQRWGVEQCDRLFEPFERNK